MTARGVHRVIHLQYHEIVVTEVLAKPFGCHEQVYALQRLLRYGRNCQKKYGDTEEP
jgi:hypothetical protein